MNKIVLLILVLTLTGLFNSCGTEYCRVCEEFSAEISNLRNDDEAINSIKAYINESETIEFQLDSIIVNEAFEACDIANFADQVTCITMKEYFYNIAALNLKFSENFENWEDSYVERMWGRYRYNGLLSDTIYESIIYLINDSLSFQSQLELVDTLSQFGITYNNVRKFNIEHVINLTTKLYGTPTLFKSFYFKKEIGLVAFETVENGIYMLEK